MATKADSSILSKKGRNEPIAPRVLSHAFPPSPSLSRSPRRLSVSEQSHPSASSTTHSYPSPWSQPSSKLPEVFSGLTIGTGSQLDLLSAKASAPVSPLESISPWSTDDDSNWDAASVATSASVQTDSTRHQGRRTRSPVLLHNSAEVSDLPSNSFVFKGSDSNRPLYIDLSQENLPHIPLRPFRNQVGGHKSIYKFTKQAVCKVRIQYFLAPSTPDRFFFLFFFGPRLNNHSPLFHGRIYFTKPLRGKLPLSWALFRGIWESCWLVIGVSRKLAFPTVSIAARRLLLNHSRQTRRRMYILLSLLLSRPPGQMNVVDWMSSIPMKRNCQKSSLIATDILYPSGC
jgi:hypothetical protein